MGFKMRPLPPYQYVWLPTAPEFAQHPLESIMLYELLYILTLAMLSPVCFMLGFAIGRIWLLVI